MGMVVQGLIMIGVAALLAGAGYLVRYRGKLNLIAGYDERKVADKAGLQRFAGNAIFTLAGILFAGGVLTAVLYRWEQIATAVLVITWIAFVIYTFTMIVRAQRYTVR